MQRMGSKKNWTEKTEPKKSRSPRKRTPAESLQII